MQMEKKGKEEEKRKAVESSLPTYYIRNNNKAMRLSNRRHFSNSNYPLRLVPFFSLSLSLPPPILPSLPGVVGRELRVVATVVGGDPCFTG